MLPAFLLQLDGYPHVTENVGATIPLPRFAPNVKKSYGPPWVDDSSDAAFRSQYVNNLFYCRCRSLTELIITLISYAYR